MPVEDAILAPICDWARGDARVRLMVLGGSRGRDDPAVDWLSDYDLSLFVTGVGSFANDDGWYEQFGQVLVRRRDTAIVNGEEVPLRQVIYSLSDGPGRPCRWVGLDFSVHHVRLAQALYASHRVPDDVKLGYRVLVDKDTRAYEFRPVDGAGYVPQRPRPAEFVKLVGDFFWETTAAAKHLARGDLVQAKYSLECVIRQQHLARLLGWYVQLGRAWRCNPGRHGSRLPTLLPPGRWEELVQTYAAGGIEANWQSLSGMCRIFRDAAREIAAELGLPYPAKLDADVTDYLAEVHRGKQSDRRPPC